MIFHNKQEIAYDMKPLAVKEMKRMSIFLIFFLGLNIMHVSAQRNKIDTIRMKIALLECYIQNPKGPGNYLDIFSDKYIIELDTAIENSMGYLDLLRHNTENIDGVLIYNDDVLTYNLGGMGKMGLDFTKFFDKIPAFGYMDNVKPLQIDYFKNYRYYTAYKFDVEWIKYTFIYQTQKNDVWAERYWEQRPKAPKNIFVYYVLNRIFSKAQME